MKESCQDSTFFSMRWTKTRFLTGAALTCIAHEVGRTEADSNAVTTQTWPQKKAQKKGSDPNCRHGPLGAAHNWGLTPFSEPTLFKSNRENPIARSRVKGIAVRPSWPTNSAYLLIQRGNHSRSVRLKLPD